MVYSHLKGPRWGENPSDPSNVTSTAQFHGIGREFSTLNSLAITKQWIPLSSVGETEEIESMTEINRLSLSSYPIQCLRSCLKPSFQRKTFRIVPINPIHRHWNSRGEFWRLSHDSWATAGNLTTLLLLLLLLLLMMMKSSPPPLPLPIPRI